MEHDNDTISYIVWAVLLAAVAVWIYSVYRRRWLIRKRFQIDELFKTYFQNGIAASELGRRVRAVVSRGFIGGEEFYAMTVAAFQRAVDAKRAQAAQFEQEQRKLLMRLAALKTEFGLTDRYLIEGWRTGRE